MIFPLLYCVLNSLNNSSSFPFMFNWTFIPSRLKHHEYDSPQVDLIPNSDTFINLFHQVRQTCFEYVHYTNKDHYTSIHCATEQLLLSGNVYKMGRFPVTPYLKENNTITMLSLCYKHKHSCQEVHRCIVGMKHAEFWKVQHPFYHWWQSFALWCLQIRHFTFTLYENIINENSQLQNQSQI